jgi:hypothetical protein
VLSKAAKGVELIQQWQYLGNVHPKLLEDKAFEYCKRVGITSVQSYVTWAEIEKQPGEINFSIYDILVEKLRKHNLKWVPFFILGPYYATPVWFQKTKDSLYAKCLEHGQETRIQSIWNPNLPKHVDRFLQLLGTHYGCLDVLESIELGISGNWGEALYPINGGFFHSKVGFHTHPGWWCGDRYAILSFRRFLSEKYASVTELNGIWGTSFRHFGEAGFPSLNILKNPFIKKRRWLKLAYEYLGWMPDWAKPWIKNAWKGVKFALSSVRKAQEVSPTQQQWCLDFVSWYLKSMTDWAEFWVKTARKYFPDIEIYLVTGADGNPIFGADFSAQTKMAAKYKAGIRVTNQKDDYARSFIMTRLVSSASRFYHTYFTTEEAGVSTPNGVTMRVFDAATTGAKGAYFKSIIGMGIDICSGNTYPMGQPTQGAVNLAQNIHHLTLSGPIIEVAVLFPNVSIALNPIILRNSLYKHCSQLRDVLDIDLVDENMIADGVLDKYRFLVLLGKNLLRPETLTEIERWVKAGGVLIAADYIQFSTIEDNRKIYNRFFSRPDKIKRIDKGYTVLYCGREYLEFIKQAIYNQEQSYPWEGMLEIDNEWDGVYATQFTDRILYYNSTDIQIRKRIEFDNSSRKEKVEISISPHSIVSVSKVR